MDTSPHKSDFVHVNGINLHYLDWGGEGETIIFLAETGSSAHNFDRIAPRFTDQFRVLALTRRGQAESDCPKSGYDLDTLVEDILDFMDTSNIEKAILAGSSFAGVELTCFIEKHPERVSKLVYFDAVYSNVKGRREILKSGPAAAIQPPNEKTEFSTVGEYIEYVKYLDPGLARIWNEVLDETAIYDLEKNSDGKFIEKDTSFIMRQMLEGATAYNPQHINIRVPVLCFEAEGTPIRPSYFTDEQRKAADDFHQNKWMPYRRKESAQFRQDIPQAKLIVISNGHHACYISNEDLVYQEMKKFLLE